MSTDHKPDDDLTRYRTTKHDIYIIGYLDQWGIIPTFISPFSDEPLWKQIHNKYSHGGGWKDFPLSTDRTKPAERGFVVHKGNNNDQPYFIQYPGDPVLYERGRIIIGEQVLALFDGSWVLWSDGTDTKIAKIDLIRNEAWTVIWRPNSEYEYIVTHVMMPVESASRASDILHAVMHKECQFDGTFYNPERDMTETCNSMLDNVIDDGWDFITIFPGHHFEWAVSE